MLEFQANSRNAIFNSEKIILVYFTQNTKKNIAKLALSSIFKIKSWQIYS